MASPREELGYDLSKHHEPGAQSVNPAEKQWGLLRLSLSICLFLGTILLAGGSGSGQPVPSAVIVTGSYLAFSLFLAACIAMRPKPSVLRQGLALGADIALLSCALYLDDQLAIPLVLAYVWVAVSNGFRFGLPFLLGACALNAAGVGWVLLASEYWSAHTALGSTLLLASSAIPLLFSGTVMRLHTGRIGQAPRTRPGRNTSTVTAAETEDAPAQIIQLAERLLQRPSAEEQRRLAQKLHDQTKALLADTTLSTGGSRLAGNPPSPARTQENAKGALRVLLISPDEHLRQRVKELVLDWGFAFTPCSTALRAISKLMSAATQGQPYNAVLVDQQGMNLEASELARLLRSEDSLGGTALILISAAQSQPSKEELEKAGYSAVLSAPLDKTLLFNALHNAPHELQQASRIPRLIDRYGGPRRHATKLDILVGTGNIGLRTQLCKMLERGGHQAFIVDTGDKALNALDTRSFDLAILDSQMPVMSGVDTAKLYRFTHLNDPWLPFILVAPAHEPETIRQCKKADIDACLTAPIKAHELNEAIEHLVDGEGHSNRPLQAHEDTKQNHREASDRGPYEHEILGHSTLRELEKLGSGQDFVLNLINGFIQDSDYMLAQMESAYNLRQYEAYIDLAHIFKDSAGNLGALAMFNLSVAATRLSKEEFGKEGGHLLKDIRVAFEMTRKALMDYVSTQDESASKE